MGRFQRKFGFIIALICIGLLFVLAPHLQAQQAPDARVDRWLTIRELSGSVQYTTADGSRPATVGNLLTTVGDRVRTGRRSSSVIDIDTGIGTITLRENTELEVRYLGFAPDNGRITYLYVPQGSVSVQLRRFTHRGSQFEIETPAGVSGVRGTEFGVIVHPEDSRTGVATESGEVAATAQGGEVEVSGGTQTLIRFGEPPLPPTPIPSVPVFYYRLNSVVRDGLRYWVLVGRIDPINQVYVNDEPQTLDRLGLFNYEILAHRGANLQVRVVTPLGNETAYVVPIL